LLADATEPTAKGYTIIVACPCGVTFERWITPLDAKIDLTLLARFN
jgi:hypothetical protein